MLATLPPRERRAGLAEVVKVKSEVVGLDERETGLRALLNLGHTQGRARHGEAVAVGMVFAARFSERRGLAPAGIAARLEALLRRAGLPTEAPDLHAQKAAYLRGIAVDKKLAGERVAFVVLREIGRAELLPLSPAEILEGAG